MDTVDKKTELPTRRFARLSDEGNADRAVVGLLERLLEAGLVQAALVPARQPHGVAVMPTLISDPGQLRTAAPLAPVAWTNAGRLAAAVSFESRGAAVAAVLRGCEVRALVELVKLNQGSAKDLLLVGLDCHGRLENAAYQELAQGEDGLLATVAPALEVVPACQACEYPVAPGVDLRVCLLGIEPDEAVWLEGASERGLQALGKLGLQLEAEPAGRPDAVRELRQRRAAGRAALLGAFVERTADMEGLREVLAGCVGCHNCRVACPVCYCRECVFSTDTFRHTADQYLGWARKQGQLPLPADTLFFHLTRMVHMSTLCVSCGQCSSACPNSIPVMELLASVGDATQARFGYNPGLDPEQEQPQATFHADELDDVTGQHK